MRYPFKTYMFSYRFRCRSRNHYGRIVNRMLAEVKVGRRDFQGFSCMNYMEVKDLPYPKTYTLQFTFKSQARALHCAHRWTRLGLTLI